MDNSIKDSNVDYMPDEYFSRESLFSQQLYSKSMEKFKNNLIKAHHNDQQSCLLAEIDFVFTEKDKCPLSIQEVIGGDVMRILSSYRDLCFVPSIMQGFKALKPSAPDTCGDILFSCDQIKRSSCYNVLRTIKEMSEEEMKNFEEKKNILTITIAISLPLRKTSKTTSKKRLQIDPKPKPQSKKHKSDIKEPRTMKKLIQNIIDNPSFDNLDQSRKCFVLKLAFLDKTIKISDVILESNDPNQKKELDIDKLTSLKKLSSNHKSRLRNIWRHLYQNVDLE